MYAKCSYEFEPACLLRIHGEMRVKGSCIREAIQREPRLYWEMAEFRTSVFATKTKMEPRLTGGELKSSNQENSIFLMKLETISAPSGNKLLQ